MMFRVFLISLCLLGPSARACDLALVLAVDVSGSVDQEEFSIQMNGLAAGLRDSIVSEALVRGQAELMLIQWTGASRQQVTIPWMSIRDFSALERFARLVETDRRVWRNYSTAIGEALAFSKNQFEDVRHCMRRLIDISGDGVSNEGLQPRLLRDTLQDAGITVNAIAIEESEPELTVYFFEHVISGAGAFVETASDFRTYPETIRRKLRREVSKFTAYLAPPGTSRVRFRDPNDAPGLTGP